MHVAFVSYTVIFSGRCIILRAVPITCGATSRETWVVNGVELQMISARTSVNKYSTVHRNM